jgi:serine/threonine protein kinase/tetratricopeptide (TPR) repeat protein
MSSLSFQHSINGTNIGKRFKLIKSLGKGGMGEIILAEDVKLKRKVAIKSVSTDAISDGDMKARFLREAQAASRLDHPNICTIYEITEEQDREFIIMQYVDGVTLDQLYKVKPLSLDKIIGIAMQIVEGMAAAQAQNIVHRDIKPGNIMIDRSGQVKILDFGLAKICAGMDAAEEDSRLDPDLTEKGIVLGTVSYMSPEQAKGLRLDGRSDIFSFGIVLYEMIENRNPFSDDENIVTLYNILHREIQFSRNVPDALQKVVRKALQKDRGRRYHSFREIKKDLAALTQTGRLAASGETEIIDAREQADLLREADRQRQASDGEHLSEMVRRLKRMKASTQALRTTRSRRFWLVAVAITALAAILVWLGVRVPGRHAAGGMAGQAAFFNILLYPFENQTADKKLAPEINYLLRESLDQFSEFKVLEEATLRDLNGGGEISAARLLQMQAQYNIRYVLRGKLSSVSDKFNIEARLSPIAKHESHAPFFLPGKEKNSLLTDQIDNLARRIQQSVLHLPETAPIPVKLAAMFGSDWQAFALFYQGMNLWEKKQFGPARQFLINSDSLAGKMPAARYYLSLLADYTGSAAEARKYLNALLPQLKHFNRPLQLKTMALKAKFDSNFTGQIRCLRELKSILPFHKEAFLELGEAYFRHGDAARAIPEFQAALSLDPNYAAALNHLGYCHSYLGRHQQAIECFERYRDIDRTANSFDSLGDGYFYMGDYTQSENNKIYAISLDDSMDWPYLTVADIHVLRADFLAAGKSLLNYEKLASYPKARADALNKKAFISFVDGDHVAAMKFLDQALRQHDSTVITEHSAESHWLKGLCQAGRGDLPAARQELRWLQALRDKYHLTADNFDAALKYCLHLDARIAENEGRPEEAEKKFADLLAMKTQLSFWITYYNYQFFLNDYAEFLLRQKNFPAAREAVETCLAFNGNYPPALWTKVSLLKLAGDRSYLDVLKQIAEIYGPGPEQNFWRRRLARESRGTAQSKAGMANFPNK